MATARQKKAIKKLVENGGKSVSKAMREAGYSAKTAKNPEKLTESKAFKELLADQIPNELIVQKLKEGLDANRVISAISGKQASGATTDFIEVPDQAVRHKYVETSMKAKGILIDKHELTGPDGEDFAVVLKIPHERS
jgi:hypothetical protein